MRICAGSLGLLLTLLAALPALPAAAADSLAETLARAQELLDGERAQEALDLLAKAPARGAAGARVLLLRSTARLMLGDVEAGRKDLDRALELDPTLRQGWLNRAGLEIAAERYGPALEALGKAEELDPGAPDNDLNIGTVLLLAGRLGDASERFRHYLAGAGNSAEGYYLVASNYATAGYAVLAVEHLSRAIALDEHSRLRARTDRNFAALEDNDAYRELMAADPQPPPPGAYLIRRTFSASYDGGDSKLLTAVLDALQLTGVPFDPRVEVTADWALIWGEMRILVRTGSDGKGMVEASAPADRFTPEAWQSRTAELFRRIQVRLVAVAAPLTDGAPETAAPASPPTPGP
jgi:tetratricopeptide (TPR) repeat protein